MAIYHLTTYTMTRASGHSAVAAAAYRSASRLVDERTGEVHDFTRKAGVLSAEIVMPSGMSALDRERLWNNAEIAEKRKDARTAREWRIALPHELTEGERNALARQMAQRIADRYGVAVDVCIHAPDRHGDDRNFHAHMLATTRTVGADGRLGAKAAIELANKDRLKAGVIGTTHDDIRELRKEWTELANASLEREGHSARIDDRSYRDQGVTLSATRHIGSDAIAMDRRGVNAERIELHGIDRSNQARQIAERPELIFEKLTATKAVFDRRDIATELHRYIDDAAQFQTLLAKLETSPQLVEMERADGERPARYSTREMVETERRMADTTERLASTETHAVPAATVEAAIGGAGTLSDEQKAAIRHITQASGLAVVIGDAGTGKSFSMKVAREAWEAQGFTVRGAALAGKAADELQAGSGIESRTLASLEYAWREGKSKLTRRDVLVIDEAGMIGSRQLGRVLDAVENAGAKVVLLGDHKQLAAIEAGAAFRAVVQHVGASEITEVRRQRHAWAREAGQQFARGSVEDGLRAYDERGYVQMHDSREAARNAVATAYASDKDAGSQIVLAHSNKDVQALNAAIRETLKHRGELDGGARFMTERGEREFAAGDRIVFLRNDRGLAVKNGTLGTVEHAEDGAFSVRLDNGEIRHVTADRYSAVDHGYAVTIHKAQGVTVDHAYLLATPGMDRSLAYVGMTRHRDTATLFAALEDFGGSGEKAARTQLARTLSRERPKESTLDFADRRGFDGEGVLRRLIERGQAKLGELARRAEQALGRVFAREGRSDRVPSMQEAGGRPRLGESTPSIKTVAEATRRASKMAAERAASKATHGAWNAATKSASLEEQRNLAPRLELGSRQADEEAYARMVKNREDELRGRATRLVATLEAQSEALSRSYRAHQLAEPREPHGIAARLSAGKDMHAQALTSWLKQDRHLVQRMRAVQRRQKAASDVARGPLVAARLAEAKVRREQPALWGRIEARHRELQKQRSTEMKQQIAQQYRGHDRGHSR